MLNKDVPQLYTRVVRDQVLLDLMLSERECRESAHDETEVDLETRGRLRRIRKATEAAAATLSHAPLDTAPTADTAENCRNEPLAQPDPAAPDDEADLHERYFGPAPDDSDWDTADAKNCRNEPAPATEDARRAFLASFPTAHGQHLPRPSGPAPPELGARGPL